MSGWARNYMSMCSAGVSGVSWCTCVCIDMHVTGSEGAGECEHTCDRVCVSDCEGMNSVDIIGG